MHSVGKTIQNLLRQSNSGISEDFASDSSEDSDLQDERKRQSTKLKRQVHEREKLIPTINKLQDIFKTTGADQIALPQIVVVGDQSSGKSSVLENIVGKSFLPRGTGIVTRCPILIQCVLNEFTDDDDDYWEFKFSHDPAKIYLDTDKVREAIEDRTRYLTDNVEKGITNKPIIIRITSNRVIPLTLVDLPGIVKPVGDQPEDIENHVKELIKDFVLKEENLILSVSPGNADIATSESVKFCRLADPEGHRTLMVITKLDLLDPGTNANAILRGDDKLKGLKAKLGIIGVKNRSQLDINNNKSIEESQIEEQKFFRENYPFLGKNCGSSYLAEQLNKLLMLHIQESLPKLKENVLAMIQKYESEMNNIPPSVPTLPSEKKYLMDDAINEFVDRFKKVADSCPLDSDEPEDNFASEIANMFRKYSMKITTHTIDNDGLIHKIQNTLPKSVNIENFTNIEKTFKVLAKAKLLELEKIWINAAYEMQKVLLKAVKNNVQFGCWPELNIEILSICRSLLAERLNATVKSAKEELKIRTCMISSSDMKYRELLKIFASENNEADEADEALALEDFPQIPSKSSFMQGQSSCESTEYSCKSFPVTTMLENRNSVAFVRQLILAYCSAKQHEIADYVPQHVLYHLFNETSEQLKNEIRKSTNGKEDQLICETSELMLKRSEITEHLENFRRAKRVIEELIMDI